MAQFVTLKGRRGKPASFCIDHISILTEMTDGKTQLSMLSNAQPHEVAHSRQEVLRLIDDARKTEVEFSE